LSLTPFLGQAIAPVSPQASPQVVGGQAPVVKVASHAAP
jgi:hypothetical protein